MAIKIQKLLLTPQKRTVHCTLKFVCFCRILSTIVKTTVGFPLCTELIKVSFRVCLLGGGVTQVGKVTSLPWSKNSPPLHTILTTSGSRGKLSRRFCWSIVATFKTVFIFFRDFDDGIGEKARRVCTHRKPFCQVWIWRVLRCQLPSNLADRWNYSALYDKSMKLGTLRLCSHLGPQH